MSINAAGMNYLSSGGDCLCCSSFPLLAVIYLGIPFSLTLCFEYIAKALLPKSKWVTSILSVISRLFNVLVVLLAVFLGAVATRPRFQSYVFYKLFTLIEQNPNPMDGHRCSRISNISGRVLEIGPGAGANFRCWQNNTEITEWVGVEPNEFMHQVLADEKDHMGITFPTSTVWLKGEDIAVEEQSFDFVVGSHVLCSVDDITQVLRQVNRALKPGGTYFFMEHVAAPAGTAAHYVQVAVSPFFNLIGGNCKFKKTWEYLSETTGLPGFRVTLEHFEAPVPMLPIVPHVIGEATKHKD